MIVALNWWRGFRLVYWSTMTRPNESQYEYAFEFGKVKEQVYLHQGRQVGSYL
jgi:hypothetical protein